MRSREASLKELKGLQSRLTHTLIQLHGREEVPILVSLLAKMGGYVTSHLDRLHEWGSRPSIDDLDLIGYSTRCIFEANLLLEYYGQHQPRQMYDLMRSEIDRDDFDILESVTSYHGSATDETQPLFDEYDRRKQTKNLRTPPFAELAEKTGAAEEYKSFYKLYSKYAHPTAYLLLADRREVWSGFVRVIFLDRAVTYADHCATAMDRLLSHTV